LGSHTGGKGHREAIEIFSRANIQKATFLLVGNDFGGCTRSCKKKESKVNESASYRRNEKRLIVTSLTREDTVAAFKAADLFLFPSNIECSPIVLFECMASRTPFLTTDVGNAAEIAAWSGSGTVLPTRKSPYHKMSVKGLVRMMLSEVGMKDPMFSAGDLFSKALIKESVAVIEGIYRRPEERQKMAEVGFRIWRERFTWKKIAQRYEELYGMLLEDPQTLDNCVSSPCN
jgi:glycosyltransferase involved in cell wall biosynthesis